VRLARKKMFFDSGKARTELGYEATQIDEALNRAIKFFQMSGLARIT